MGWPFFFGVSLVGGEEGERRGREEGGKVSFWLLELDMYYCDLK